MRFRRRFFKPLRSMPHGRVIQLSPPELLLLGFVFLSLLGTLILMLPISAHSPLSWNEALFTATSAVTVTGLTVISTSELTLFGQVMLLCMFQLGGLGFMTFTAMTLMIMGMRIPLNHQNLIRENFNHTSFRDLTQLVRTVVTFTLLVQGFGMALLASAWVPEHGLWWGLWLSLFHAISGFNGAGFTLWTDSLVTQVADPMVNAAVIMLIVAGGLGFVVVAEVRDSFRGHKLSLHSRIMLHATFWLILISTIAILLLEWGNEATLGGLDGLGVRLQAALFQAVTPRSAGLNTLDTAALREPTTLLTILLMFIGAGPGSAASGIKITTFVVLILVARSFVRGSSQPTAFGRAIPDSTVFKAIAVALGVLLLIFTCLFILTISEPGKDFLDLTFEAVSASGAVGLSRGITDELSLPGQLTVIVAMLLGRAGPISLGYFLAMRRPHGIKYAEGQVHIG
ncbi:TrkH family potassium uptake protein [Halomonas sp. PR-M31]|uniref:TrkH family potassium uptake protein n=1 Tax=Halomonas sp. PR-M31 TaxID=1471202 RepID=UPI00069E545F|nr:potassium transporter TrkG [Halomonas sp. PR-M31]